MCGITGFVDFSQITDGAYLSKMVDTLNHRGPDGRGEKIINHRNATIGLGHTRLSIIELSELGQQPMSYHHLDIVYNGEVYNFQEVREELIKCGHSFESGSDTEVILHAFMEWGKDAVHKFVGMFAFALLDKKKEVLHLYRDRAGVKPLYYYFKDGLFLFGSELKSLMAHERFRRDVNPKVLRNYFHYGYIASPHTILKDCYKLEPGYSAELHLGQEKLLKEKYWDVLDYYVKEKSKISYQDAKFELKELLRSAYNYRMVSDVPVGVFLSGGYDSTSVAAILQSESSERLKTFTIGFEEGNNEAPYARQTAEFLGTDHTELICTTKEAQDIIRTLPYLYDEPFGDSSAVPTTLVSRLARQSVTVALSADGGDEVFCGYNRYAKTYQLSRKLSAIPSFAVPILRAIAPAFTGILPMGEEHRHKLRSAVFSLKRNEYAQVATLFRYMHEKPVDYLQKWIRGTDTVTSSFELDAVGFSDPLEVSMAIDFRSYLPEDILTKVDRATMSVSLEGREPLLDHRILEFAAGLPLSYKFDGKTKKRILRDIVHDYIPEEMLDRPKAGFSLPIYSWLRGDLSHLLDEYLSEEALSWSGLFHEKYVAGQVELFRRRKLHYVPMIWYMLMFQMWYCRWMRGD